MKLTVQCKEYGYLGKEIAAYLSAHSIFTEFSDNDYLVLMPSPQNSHEELVKLKDVLLSLPRKERITDTPPSIHIPKKALSIREAVMSDAEILPASECCGRVASSVTLGCPPAIPIAVPGEVIDKETLRCFEYYKINKCTVVK